MLQTRTSSTATRSPVAAGAPAAAILTAGSGPRSEGQSLGPIALHPAAWLLSPQDPLVLILALLGAGACIAPWFAHGWLWFAFIAIPVAFAACYDVIALALARAECSPVLLPLEKGLRGREGETIPVPFALSSRADRPPRGVIRAAIMPATRGGGEAIRVEGGSQTLRLERAAAEGGGSASANTTHLWPWTAKVTLLRRGLWPAPRVGIERQSRFGLWRLRRWFDTPIPLRIDANLRAGRQEVLRSPVYRMLVASQQTPWTGHGRDFERLREYQPGDTYAEIAWKSTARRAAPVTRLFQWEQKQEVYFVVDQSRASALTVDPIAGAEDAGSAPRPPRRMLDLAVETALVGATVALELGDEFGLVTYADGATSWLRAGSGQAQFHQFRDHLLNVDPLPTTADYESLFADLRLRLRRRAYLILLADLTERSIADSLRRGVGLVRSAHAVLMTSILPAHARPAFSPKESLSTDEDVYAALAGERENQRLAALARQLRQLDVQLRYIPAEQFLRTAVEGYLLSKREQRL